MENLLEIAMLGLSLVNEEINFDTDLKIQRIKSLKKTETNRYIK